MGNDPVTIGQIGIALRETIMRKDFAKQLCKVTGADGFTFATGERSSTRVENVTHLSIDGAVFRIVIERTK